MLLHSSGQRKTGEQVAYASVSVTSQRASCENWLQCVCVCDEVTGGQTGWCWVSSSRLPTTTARLPWPHGRNDPALREHLIMGAGALLMALVTCAGDFNWRNGGKKELLRGKPTWAGTHQPRRCVNQEVTKFKTTVLVFIFEMTRIRDAFFFPRLNTIYQSFCPTYCQVVTVGRKLGRGSGHYVPRDLTRFPFHGLTSSSSRTAPVYTRSCCTL